MEFPAPEKLLLEYEKPIIFHVIDSLNDSHCFSKVFAATSPNSPDTKHILEQNRIETLSTPGNGYVNDLNFLLQKMDGFVFVASGDLPLLDEEIIQKLVEFNSESVWTSFLVSKKFLNSLGLESSLLVNSDNIECTYTGISIINANKIKNLNSVKENYIILDDKRIAFNLNTRKDYELLNSS
jgi:adenosylcobinamide-phosphate guanylyltransferase